MNAPAAVYVRDVDHWVKVPVAKVLYVEADDNRTHIQTPVRRYTVSRVMKDVITDTPLSRLLRVHRSYAVNLEHVTAVAEGSLRLSDHRVPIGRSFRKEVMERLHLL
jgi:DNA-binding LytR/AlgR family response regulator